MNCGIGKGGDIDSGQRRLHVRHGKGGRERKIALSPALLERLKTYYRRYRPADWLFPSRQRAAEPLNDGTIRTLWRTAGRRAPIPLLVPPICFATPALPTCWTRATICAPFQFCWDTAISAPPLVTFTSR